MTSDTSLPGIRSLPPWANAPADLSVISSFQGDEPQDMKRLTALLSRTMADSENPLTTANGASRKTEGPNSGNRYLLESSGSEVWLLPYPAESMSFRSSARRRTTAVSSICRWEIAASDITVEPWKVPGNR